MDVAILRIPGRVGRGRRVMLAVMTACWVIGGARAPRAQDPAPPPPPAPVEAGQAPDHGAEADASGGQVLTQGPVHEAFAAPVVHDPKANALVAKQPPDPIQEMSPDQKPAGQNIQWIPGYWAWDTTRNDYLWVSGVWREPPPGTQWVPGYWHNVDGGFQWVPGSWMPASAGASRGTGQSPASQATYLPPPPGSLENGPTSPQPGPNTAWTPGYWFWQGSGYVWRPGFWSAVQPNWIWIPAHYVWSPSGYLFVPGYWDLPVANRGLMFAPVYYPQPVYAQVGFAFTPSVAIVGSAMTSNLFVSVGTGQYLFGNYYGQANVSVGIVPWFSFSFAVGRPAFYDPLFSYYAVVNVRENPRWVAQVREAYVLRRDNVALRPPVTYAEQVRVMRSVSITRDITVVDHRNVAMPLRQLAADPIAGRNLRLEHVAEAERRVIQRQATELHQMREQRAQFEHQAARSGPASRPRTVSLPHSPVASHPASRPAGHPGGHPSAHPGGEGARAAVAHREGAAGGREAGARAGQGGAEARHAATEAHRAATEARAGGAAEGRHPATGESAARPGNRQPTHPGAPARGRPSAERERERRP
jgi:hypothetical protein